MGYPILQYITSAFVAIVPPDGPPGHFGAGAWFWGACSWGGGTLRLWDALWRWRCAVWAHGDRTEVPNGAKTRPTGMCGAKQARYRAPVRLWCCRCGLRLLGGFQFTARRSTLRGIAAGYELRTLTTGAICASKGRRALGGGQGVPPARAAPRSPWPGGEMPTSPEGPVVRPKSICIAHRTCRGQLLLLPRASCAAG